MAASEYGFSGKDTSKEPLIEIITKISALVEYANCMEKFELTINHSSYCKTMRWSEYRLAS